MPRPDSLHHTTHYYRPDCRNDRTPDYFALQTWADCWDDATTPRTDDPVYFNSMTRSPLPPYIHRASEN
jgi:hypothetical protein